jgi:hypothetical protein
MSAGPTDSVAASPGRGIARQVVANTSLLIAVLVYMGWAYDDALFGYFHIRPLDLNVSVVEYMLRSLSLFSTTIVIALVIVVAVTTVRTWDLGRVRFTRPVSGIAATGVSAIPVLRRLVSADAAERSRAGQALTRGAGAVLTIAALGTAWLAGHVQVSTYGFLLLLGIGPLLLTWPARADHRGRFPYALAIVVAAVCALWAASLYAHNLGFQAAGNIVRHLSTRTAVVVYSVQPLALSGPGVTMQPLPATYRYHYRYQGLRLLITREGIYYLLPVDWNPGLNETYVFDETDQIRIELLGAEPAS